MQPSIVALSGSMSGSSKTALLTDHILQLVSDGLPARHYRISAVDPAALLSGNMADPLLKEMVDAVSAAHGVVIATPIYKAAYSGLLKVFLDVLPQFALSGTAVLPIGTGGSVAHVLALDYALRPVLQSMGARHIVQSHFVAESSISVVDGMFALQPDSAGPLDAAIQNFRHTLTAHPTARHLGHPRPPEATARAFEARPLEG